MSRDTVAVVRHTCVLLARDPGTLIAYTVMSSVLMAVLRPVYDRLSGPGDGGVLSAAAGTSVMFTLLALDVAGEQLLAERDWHTWSRLHATPAGSAALMTGKAVPLVVLFTGFQALLFGEAHWWYGLDLTRAGWRLPLLWLAWACCVSGLGLALGAWLRSRGQLGALADIGAMVMMGLSGALVPLSGLPGWFSALAPFTPGYWAVHGFRAACLAGRSAGPYDRALLTLLAIALAATVLAALPFLRRNRRS